MRCLQRLGKMGGLEGFGPLDFFLSFFCIILYIRIRGNSDSQLTFRRIKMYVPPPPPKPDVLVKLIKTSVSRPIGIIYTPRPGGTTTGCMPRPL